ncbi:hypothetical protein BDZ45DRAFT_705022 [Acephala macrosclerotiorum]|nr:hypothetical protein BDZ45DRAFT_705022 [Acephala macrosclerotiorum]
MNFSMTPQPRLNLTSLSSLRVSRHQIPHRALIPNTSIRNKLFLIYHSCLPSSATASTIETHLKAAGFGGENNPGRVEPVVEKGDVIVVPAGVGHRLLDDFGSGFEMVGSYPKGKHKVKDIADLGWFKKDPLYGDEGPTLQK